MSLTHVGTQRDILGECPVWDDQEQALYWVDIRRPALRRLDPAGDTETREMPGLVGAIALTRPGTLLVALAERVALYDWRTGQLHTVAELPVQRPGHRFNDGRCDRQGRFWVGTMHNLTRAPEGVLYRLDPPGTLVPVLDKLCIPNSLAWSPDGQAMYFADSLRHCISRHDFDPRAGAMGEARPFAATSPPGFPDGSTVDAEGCLWNAEFNAGRVVRYAPDGRVDRVIPVPTRRPTSCGFGGPDLRTLFITSTSQDMSDAELEDEPLAGALFALDAGVSGIAEPRWAGLAASARPGEAAQ